MATTAAGVGGKQAGMSEHKCEGMPDDVSVCEHPEKDDGWYLSDGNFDGQHVDNPKFCPFCGEVGCWLTSRV